MRGTGLGVLIFAAVLFAESVSLADTNCLFFSKPMTLGAHRGGKSLWPENTVEGYRKAVEQWPDILLEGDAHLTADGQVVLIHDDEVDRTTDGKGAVSRMTLAELKKLDAGYRFTTDGGQTYPYRGKGLTIPTFAEVLAAFPNSRFLIELKPQTGVADAMVKVLQEAKAVDRVALASFSGTLMEIARRKEPNLISCFDIVDGMALVQALRNGKWAEYQPACNVLAADRKMLKSMDLKPEEVRSIREKGIRVIVFTVNSPEEAKTWLDVGVDSILTDDPAMLAQVAGL